MARQKFTGTAGLPLARRAVRILKDQGIYAHSVLSVEHQQLAQRYVIRGLESGGCAGVVGRYVTFAGEHGLALEYLHPVEAIGVNGLHAVVISAALVRVDMLRKGRTYELLMRVELDLSGKDKAQAGDVVPTFYSLAGEVIAIPEKFLQLVRATTKGVNCSACTHTHYLRRPRPVGQPRPHESAHQDAGCAEAIGTLAG